MQISSETCTTDAWFTYTSYFLQFEVKLVIFGDLVLQLDWWFPTRILH